MLLGANRKESPCEHAMLSIGPRYVSECGLMSHSSTKRKTAIHWLGGGN